MIDRCSCDQVMHRADHCELRDYIFVCLDNLKNSWICLRLRIMMTLERYDLEGWLYGLGEEMY